MILILKVLLIVILIVVLAGTGIAVGTVKFVKAYGRKKKTLPKEPLRSGPSKLGTCSRCGKERIIVAVAENLCAPCYSAMRTKKLDG